MTERMYLRMIVFNMMMNDYSVYKLSGATFTNDKRYITYEMVTSNDDNSKKTISVKQKQKEQKQNNKTNKNKMSRRKHLR